MERKRSFNHHPVFRLLQAWGLLALGVLIAATLVPGIAYDTGGTLILVVIVLGLFNAVLKPLLVLFTLPFILLTMGLGILLINAVLFMLAGRLVPGFEVSGFGAALLGAILISFVAFLVNLFLPLEMSYRATMKGRRPGRPGRRDKDDVIDI